MSTEAQEERREPVQPIVSKQVLVKIDPHVSDQFLFDALKNQLPFQPKIELSKLGIEQLLDLQTDVLAQLLQKIHSIYLVPLAAVTHPVHGDEIVKDRIKQIITLLASINDTIIRSTANKIAVKQYKTKEELRTMIKTALVTTTTILLAMREAINRMTTMFHINAPMGLRPPLANTKIGYDLLQVGR